MLFMNVPYQSTMNFLMLLAYGKNHFKVGLFSHIAAISYGCWSIIDLVLGKPIYDIKS